MVGQIGGIRNKTPRARQPCSHTLELALKRRKTVSHNSYSEYCNRMGVNGLRREGGFAIGASRIALHDPHVRLVGVSVAPSIGNAPDHSSTYSVSRSYSSSTNTFPQSAPPNA
jgi:hypothetical protein